MVKQPEPGPRSVNAHLPQSPVLGGHCIGQAQLQRHRHTCPEHKCTLVKENALFGVQLRDGKNFASKEAQYEKELMALAERLSIEKLLSRYPSSLSGGQAQRTALLRVLLMRPLLLLMDEPFAALDAAASIEAAMLCLELWKEYRPTTVMVTHRLEDAMALATDIVVMNQRGKISACYQNPWQGSYDCQEEEYFQMKRKLREAVLAAHGKGKEKS